jgi:hypothetical protein
MGHRKAFLLVYIATSLIAPLGLLLLRQCLYKHQYLTSALARRDSSSRASEAPEHNLDVHGVVAGKRVPRKLWRHDEHRRRKASQGAQNQGAMNGTQSIGRHAARCGTGRLHSRVSSSSRIVQAPTHRPQRSGAATRKRLRGRDSSTKRDGAYGSSSAMASSAARW